MPLDLIRFPIGAMPEPSTYNKTDKQKWLADISRLAEDLTHLINHTPPSSWDIPYRQQGWTTREVIHHICDCDLHYYIRMKATITEASPTIAPFEEQEWAIQKEVYTIPIEDAIATIALIRKRMVHLLSQTPETNWQHYHIHPQSNQPITVWQMALKTAWHGKHHYMQLATLQKRINQYTLPVGVYN